MNLQRQGWIVWITVLTCVVTVKSISRSDLFQYGEDVGDSLLEQGTDQSQELTLDKPLFFYDGSFNSVFVSHQSFHKTCSSFRCCITLLKRKNITFYNKFKQSFARNV